MFFRRLLLQTVCVFKAGQCSIKPNLYYQRYFLHISPCKWKETNQSKSVITKDPFNDVKEKNRDTYLQMINIFLNRDHVYRRGHVDFIYAALSHMKEFGVERDLEVYRALIDVLPKGKFVPRNIIQAEFMHYPKQQQCIIDLLTEMEVNHVLPDFEMEGQLVAIFGRRGYAVRRYWRMMYWMPKWKYASPFPLPDPLPTDTYELAKLAIERISNVDPTNQVTIYHSADLKDAVDDTWIIGAQSKSQKTLLESNKPEDPLFVEGPFHVFLRGNYINYFILRGKAREFDDSYDDPDDIQKIEAPFFTQMPPIKNILKVVPSVHEQEDGTIYALCATGTSTKDSLLSWIRHLEIDGNSCLGNLSVVFTLKSSTQELVTVETEQQRQQQEEAKKIEES